MADTIENYIEELRHTVTVASMNYEIWWVYKSAETRPVYVDAMNDYTLFFQTSIHAHFVALLVALYRLYETRHDTYNIPGLLKILHAHNAGPAATLEKVHAIFNEAKPIWKKVGILRNDAFGHRSHAQTVEDVFIKAKITPDNLRDLIKLTQDLLNKASLAWDKSTHAFNLSARDDTLQMLKNLKALRETKASIRQPDEA